MNTKRWSKGIGLYFIYGQPLIGLLVFVLTAVFFVGIQGANGPLVWLYCALPLIFNLFTALLTRAIIEQKK
ncbi:hypothetical protein ACFQ5M_05840 [Agrilactobacillus yilanensis]|uniref:Uncharacterized protein n=1 Tax=Agrilactobacillus yilanensis TaxID=2485997 RepID=A0ABW4J5F7_9LACO|nr:hypothetical protein [Agrilactobacillus yilanensis]